MSDGNDTTNTPLKRCTKCGVEYPATIKYFSKDNKMRDGFSSNCRPCAREASRRWAEANREYRREYQREYSRKQEAREKRLTRERRYYAENRDEINRKRQIRVRKNPEKYREQKRVWSARHRETLRVRNGRWRKLHYREYADKNREHLNEWARRWRAENPDKVRTYQRRYYETHKDRVAAKDRRYRMLNKGKIKIRSQRQKEQARIASSRRRARKRNLPNGFTISDWKHCLDYFNGCCAVCGNPPGLWHTMRKITGYHCQKAGQLYRQISFPCATRKRTGKPVATILKAGKCPNNGSSRNSANVKPPRFSNASKTISTVSHNH